MNERIQAIAGVDEAGRGALAGPVVAGACVLGMPLFRRRHSQPRWSPYHRKRSIDCLIADSKQLTSEEREIAFEWIETHCCFGVGIVGNEMTERHGILWATERAMRLAIDELQSKIEIAELLIDGRDAFSFPIPHRSIIRGDSTEPCIAAASIVAKVTRDRLMRDLHPRFPAYHFDRHKGYGTASHIASIRAFGPCAFHRRSFLTRITSKQSLTPLLTLGHPA